MLGSNVEIHHFTASDECRARERVLHAVVAESSSTVTLSKDPEGLISPGEMVRFECTHSASGGGPITWVINDNYYTILNLPEKHSRDTSDYNALIIGNVDVMMNGNSYQCIVESVFSNILYLYVTSGTIRIIFISLSDYKYT